MKRRTALALVAVFLWAPIANAQARCEEIARINASALDRFESITGEYATDDFSDEIYESDARLFGSRTCLLDLFAEPMHTCRWEFKTEAAVIAAYRTYAAQMDACLTGWKREAEPLSEPDEPGYRVLGGASYDGVDIHEDIDWFILADYDPKREGAYQILIETSLPF